MRPPDPDSPRARVEPRSPLRGFRVPLVTEFLASEPLTVGIELELQLVDLGSGGLCDRAPELLAEVVELGPEVTEAMVEYNSPPCATVGELLGRLSALRATITAAAARLGVAVCGGGLHPFSDWTDRRVSAGDRFRGLRDRWAYLARQVTTFGQHVHVGCRNGDDAHYLCHALSRYVPHLIALAASSPVYRSIETGFDCARLNVLSVLPTVGTVPWTADWTGLERHLRRLHELGAIDSIKDLHWDVRPKPMTGTVEVRVCDTPLSVLEAIDLVAYVQLLSADLLASRRLALGEQIYLPYRLNRFEACRHGLQAVFVDPWTGEARALHADILRTIDDLATLSRQLGCTASLDRLRRVVESGDNGAGQLRRTAAAAGNLSQVVAWQSAVWADDALASGAA